jgi:urease subunit gamma/beta
VATVPAEPERLVPGDVVPGATPIVANPGRPTVALRVLNTSLWPVHVSSHYHFFEANRRLRFDRAAAFGMRLDILAGATVRWEPGEEKNVRLVEFAGRRHVHGFNGLVDGPLTSETKAAALARLRARGFLDAGVHEATRDDGRRAARPARAGGEPAR